MPAAPVARRMPATSGRSGTCLGASGEIEAIESIPVFATQKRKCPARRPGISVTEFTPPQAADQFLFLEHDLVRKPVSTFRDHAHFFCSAGGDRKSVV